MISSFICIPATMSSNRRLLQLASAITENTSKIDTYIEENKLPEPSFEESNPPVLNLPPDLETARKTALEALDELRDHLLGPIGIISNAVTEVITICNRNNESGLTMERRWVI